jgi:hypothetical protein
VVKKEDDSDSTRTPTTGEKGEIAGCKDMGFERDSRRSNTTPTNLRINPKNLKQARRQT